ncbi:hypothetical protein C6341_g25443 [Phytophthora cactorum]|nr:hypothetical protein PC120_g11155 [Phytophthora cactorum]KAG3126250.1 hypothetical protein C6341_g25443 [Phytophthora cactorum]
MTSSPSSIKEQGAEDSSSLNDCVLYPPNRHLLSEHVIGGVVQRSRTLRRSYAAQSFALGDNNIACREPNLPATRDRYLAIAELAISEKDRLRELRRKKQMRYRKKKENYTMSLEVEVDQLRQKIEELEQRRRSRPG